MFESENSIEFERRKYEVIITSIDILGKLYNWGTISLENYFSNDSNKFKDIVYLYYEKALKLIINGRSPEQVAFMLEYEKMKWIKKSNITEADLLLITIIQGIVPYLQKIDFQGFYDLCGILVSAKQREEIEELLLEINLYIWEDGCKIKEGIPLNNILGILIYCHLNSCKIEKAVKEFKFNKVLGRVNITEAFTLNNFTYNWLIKFEDKEIFIDIISPKNKVDEQNIKAKIEFVNEKSNLTDNRIFVTAAIYKASEKEIEYVNGENTVVLNTIKNTDDFLDIVANCIYTDILECNKLVVMIIRNGKIIYEESAIFKIL